MRLEAIIVVMVFTFALTSVFAQEDEDFIRNVSIVLSVIPENYPAQNGLVSTGYIGVNNNDNQSIFSPSDMEIELTSSNPEIIKVPPRIVIEENEPYANFDLVLSGEEGVSKISAVFQDQIITKTVSVGVVNEEVPVDVELVLMFPTENANINSTVPFSVFLRTIGGSTLQAPTDIIVKLETKEDLINLASKELIIKKGEYYVLGELHTKAITGSTFVKASVSELGITSVSSLKISANTPKNLKAYVYPDILMEQSEVDFGIFVGLYDELDNPVKATEDVKLTISGNRGNFLTDILDRKTEAIKPVIRKDTHALFFNIDADQVFVSVGRADPKEHRINPFNYTIAVSSDKYGASSDLLRIVDKPDLKTLPTQINKGVKVYIPPTLPVDSSTTVTYQATFIQDKNEDDQAADDEEETTKIFWEDFDDGEHFPGQLDRYYAPIANQFDSSVDNLRVTSDDTEVLKIQEIGIIEEQKGFGFATLKTGQKTGTANIHVDMKGWGFGSNSTEIINPIRPASTKIFSPTGENRIFFNNEGTSELVIVTLDPQERGTSTDKNIEYIIRPANDVVSIPPDSTYDTITIHSSMFGNLIKETEEENRLAKELALLENAAQEPVEKDAVASINAFSVGSPERPELEVTQKFILESSPTTISVSLPFSNIALRGIEERHDIGSLQITDHFGNSIPVSRDIQVNLTSSDSNIIEVPTIIRIPQGESFVQFPITTKGVDGEVTIHAESSGIKFDSEFAVSTNSYSTRLSLFISPPDEQQLEVGKQYELLAFVDDEFGESIQEAEVVFIGTNLEFFPTETITDEFGGATALMTVTEEVPDMAPSVQVIAIKQGYVEDNTTLDFEIKAIEQQGETVLGMPLWMLGILIAGIAGGGGGIAFFFLRKTKTAEEQEEADLEDEDFI